MTFSTSRVLTRVLLGLSAIGVCGIVLAQREYNSGKIWPEPKVVERVRDLHTRKVQRRVLVPRDVGLHVLLDLLWRVDAVGRVDQEECPAILAELERLGNHGPRLGRGQGVGAGAVCCPRQAEQVH